MKQILVSEEIPKKSLYQWIGGKKWLSKELQNIIVSRYTKLSGIDTYIEPFLGGMGAFKSLLPLLLKFNVNNFILNDINPLIIFTLQNIKDNYISVETAYTSLINDFIDTYPKNQLSALKYSKETKSYILGDYFYYELHRTKDKEDLKNIFLIDPNKFFLKVRKEFNIDKVNNNLSIKTIAQFLFLMNFCFNSVYRENSKGEFNVPFNWDNNPKNGLNKIKLFKEYNLFFNKFNIIFENLDVFQLLDKYQNYSNTFIYVDPPYMNSNNKENKYNKNEFSKQQQLKLIDYIKKYKYALYSNHSIELLEKQLQENTTYFIKYINRKNIMSSKNLTRNEDKKELLALLYN